MADDQHPAGLSDDYFSPEDITTESLNQMWALRGDHVVQVTMVRKQRDGKITVSAVVRTDDPQSPQQPPTLFLNPLSGDQYGAALAVAPTSQPRLKPPRRVLRVRDDLAIPIGAPGAVVGLESISGDQAQVLIAVSVKTTNAGALETHPRTWRMRNDVQKGTDGKPAPKEAPS